MHAKQFLMGTLSGAVTVLAIGYAIFTVALGDFYAYAMNAGSATGVSREPQLFWAVAVDTLLGFVPGAIAGGIIARVIRTTESPTQASSDTAARRAA